IGSIAGALRKYGDGLAVLWVDAHMDLNTPDTSPSGNLHGMSLAALSGLKPQSSSALDEEWMFLLEEIVGEPFLSPQNIAWLCLRDVDEGEVANSKLLPGCLPLTMQDVDQDRIVGCLQKIFDHFQKGGAKALWVSFDVDSLDPLFAPGTGTAVRGGLTYREGHLIAETLHEFFEGSSVKLAGLDIVEVNPLVDRNNETANVAMEWALSFFGKTILHPMDPGRTER
ncbi:MAG TPA: arginase family protein, partial [Fimbriimonadaceae bacterium]|nr:arginase family protein [Fimbriimonadaceae bacterium]